jgi:hypothetical protein
MRRWHQHCAQAKTSKDGRSHFANAIRKYGKDAFDHEVLGIYDTLEAANEAEKEWIEKLDSRNPERGFNLMRGGLHTPHPVRNPWDRPEYREKTLLSLKEVARRPDLKIRKSTASKKMWESEGFRERMSSISTEVHSRPDVKLKSRISQLGKKLSSETKAKMSRSLKGRIPSDNTKHLLSLASTKYFRDPLARSRISVSMTGRRLSEESKRKLSAFYEAKRLVAEQLPFEGMDCPVHGFVSSERCHISMRDRGVDRGHIRRVECKECINERARKFNRNRRSLGKTGM